MPEIALDARLSSVAEFVRQGACFADVGTDHARLPLFLLRAGRIAYAYASDISEGPLSHARAAVIAAGLDASVELLLRDGLSGMDTLGLTDIAICGMGGELIAEIIGRAPFVRDPEIRLILQPMSRARCLRSYLASSGFAIDGERFSLSGGRAYVAIAAHYSGAPTELTAAEAEIGRQSDWINPKTPPHLAYIRTRCAALQKEEEGCRHRGDRVGADLLCAARQSCERFLL